MSYGYALSDPVAVTTTGSAGAATGTATAAFGLQGRLIGIVVAFDATAPITTTIKITRTIGASPAVVTETLYDNATNATSTSGVFYIAVDTVDQEGNAGQPNNIPTPLLGTSLTVTVENTNALDPALTLWFITGER